MKTIITLYEERKKTREFYRMLESRAKKAEEKPETLIPLEKT